MNIIKTANEATGLTDQQIADIRRMMPSSPVRQLIEYDIDYAIQNLDIGAALKTVEDFHFHRGIKEGLSRAKGLLSKK